MDPRTPLTLLARRASGLVLRPKETTKEIVDDVVSTVGTVVGTAGSVVGTAHSVVGGVGKLAGDVLGRGHTSAPRVSTSPAPTVPATAKARPARVPTPRPGTSDGQQAASAPSAPVQAVRTPARKVAAAPPASDLEETVVDETVVDDGSVVRVHKAPVEDPATQLVKEEARKAGALPTPEQARHEVSGSTPAPASATSAPTAKKPTAKKTTTKKKPTAKKPTAKKPAGKPATKAPTKRAPSEKAAVTAPAKAAAKAAAAKKSGTTPPVTG